MTRAFKNTTCHEPMHLAAQVKMNKHFGYPVRGLSHDNPSARRMKRAGAKFESGMDGVGSFERKVICEANCQRYMDAERQYFGHQ